MIRKYPSPFLRVIGKKSRLRYVVTKNVCGQVPIPIPEFDWDMIRVKKAKCEAFCLKFDHLHGGCEYYLTPGIDSCGPISLLLGEMA